MAKDNETSVKVGKEESEIYAGNILLILAGVATQNISVLTKVRTARKKSPWMPSGEIISFIAEWESGVLNGKNAYGHTVTDGMILNVYNDSRGFPTVGCGHLVNANDKLSVGDTITLERAKQLFAQDQQKIINLMNNKIKVPLLQREFDALFSVTFNAGEGGALDSLSLEVNKARYDKVPEFICSFRARTGAHRLRRSREAYVWKKGVYDASH